MNPITYARSISVVARFCRLLMLLAMISRCVSPASAQTRDQVSVVNLLFLYTPEARQGAGGISALHKQIDQAVLEANTIFHNSRANLRVKVGLVAMVNFPESGYGTQDFNRIMDPNDRFFKPIRSFRATAKADLVCLVTETSSDYAAR